MLAETEREAVFVFPASAAQRRFWLLDQLVPGGNPALNMPLVARLCGQLEQEVLERSWREIVRRHEILRTTFRWEKGQFEQVIARSWRLTVPLEDRRDWPAAERARLAEQLVAEEVQRPFDLARGPLLRARLVRVANDEHLLVIALHHIVSDGWSNGVLLHELCAFYAAFVRGQATPLPELAIQFADFCAWQREHTAAHGLDEDMAYWRATLAGELPVLDLPVDRPRRPARGRPLQNGVRQETLPADLVQAVKATAARGGVTPYMLFLAAFALLLGRYSGGQEDILLTTPSANRDRREIEPLIGPFVNPLMLRIDLAAAPTFRELLARVRGVVLEAFRHAAIPFEKLLDELPPRRLQTNFVHQTHFLRPASLPDLEVVPLVTSDVALHEWTVVLTEKSTATIVHLAYNKDLYDAATIDRVLASYRRLLEAIAAPGGLETVIWQLPLEAAAAADPAGGVLLADRWRLPAGSVRWMDRCFAPADRAAGEFGCLRPGIDLLVLDRHLELVPVGVVGEICVRGWPDDGGAFDEQARIEHPRHGSFFRTSDLGRRRADGRIEWMGRADEQVWVHGLRVDPGGIEVALRAHPQIRGAVVLWRPGADGGRRLTAYVVGGPGAVSAGLSPGRLREFLRETLPEELLPADFVLVKRFPETADGRLDPAALPGLTLRWPAGGEAKSHEPYLTIHFQLRDLWQQLLGVRAISIQDDFFALGGNSLLAMRMLHRIEQIFGKPLLPVTLFRQPTIEHLATELLKDEEGQPASALIRVNDQGPRTPIFYLHGDFQGGGFYSLKLSRHLGPEQPFYVLPPLAPTDPSQPPTIQEIAARHIASIREVRPQGPYVIGGFCLGALVAFEMAHQLRASGDVVERLLVIDPNLKSERLRRLRRSVELVGRLRGLSVNRQLYLFCRWHFQLVRLLRWWRMSLRQKSRVVRRHLASWPRRGQRDAGTADPGPGTDAAGTEPNAGWFDPRWDAPIVYLWSSGGYAPQPYAGVATVLLSRDLFREHHRQRKTRVWRRHFGTPDVRELTGSHLRCITEHVETLAETIARCLDAPVAGGR